MLYAVVVWPTANTVLNAVEVDLEVLIIVPAPESVKNCVVVVRVVPNVVRVDVSLDVATVVEYVDKNKVDVLFVVLYEVRYSVPVGTAVLVVLDVCPDVVFLVVL